MGDTLHGILDRADPRSPRYGTLVESYRLSLEQGTRVDVDLRSSVFDAYLVVVDPNGERIAEDDDSGNGLDAQVTFKAALTGEYWILISSARFAEGPFELSVMPAMGERVMDPFHSATPE